MIFFCFLYFFAIVAKNLLASATCVIGFPSLSICQSMITYMPRSVAYFTPYVHLHGTLEHGGVDLQGIFHLTAELSDVVLDGGLDLLAELSGQLGHQLLHHGAHLGLNGSGKFGLQNFAQLLAQLFRVALQIARGLEKKVEILRF